MNYVHDADRREGRWPTGTPGRKWPARSSGGRTCCCSAAATGTPAVYVHKLAEDLRHFAEHRLLGTDFDSCMHNWATEGLNYYVLARLLWDPDADVDAMLDDYCRGGFRAGGWRDVRRYFTRIEELTDRIAAEGLAITAPYTPEVVAELRGLLDAAQQASAGDTDRRRVDVSCASGLEFAALQQRAHALLAVGGQREKGRRTKASRPAAATAPQRRRRVEGGGPGRPAGKMAAHAADLPREPPGGQRGHGRLGRRGGVWPLRLAGAKSMPPSAVDADEQGRPVDPPTRGK